MAVPEQAPAGLGGQLGGLLTALDAAKEGRGPATGGRRPRATPAVLGRASEEASHKAYPEPVQLRFVALGFRV